MLAAVVAGVGRCSVGGGREGLDDDQPAAAAAAGPRQHAGLMGGCAVGRLGLFRATGTASSSRQRDIGGAMAAGEQSVVADAMRSPWAARASGSAE